MAKITHAKSYAPRHRSRGGHARSAYCLSCGAIRNNTHGRRLPAWPLTFTPLAEREQRQRDTERGGRGGGGYSAAVTYTLVSQAALNVVATRTRRRPCRHPPCPHCRTDIIPLPSAKNHVLIGQAKQARKRRGERKKEKEACLDGNYRMHYIRYSTNLTCFSALRPDPSFSLRPFCHVTIFPTQACYPQTRRLATLPQRHLP